MRIDDVQGQVPGQEPKLVLRRLLVEDGAHSGSHAVLDDAGELGGEDEDDTLEDAGGVGVVAGTAVDLPRDWELLKGNLKQVVDLRGVKVFP